MLELSFLSFLAEKKFPLVRLTVEKAAKFHVPPPNQEIDLDRLKNCVAVACEEHDLNREEQPRKCGPMAGETLS